MLNLIGQAQQTDGVFRHIPIIDLANISNTNSEVQQSLANEIRDACINNHGISEDIINATVDAAKLFFDLPLEAKMEIENRKTPNFKGYSPLLSGNNNPDNAGDLQEGFEFGWEPLALSVSTQQDKDGVMAGANVWPSQLPELRENSLQYYHAAVNLGKSLFPLFALALNLPATFFDDKTRNSAALMKLLHYPPQTGTVDDRIIGIGAHTDWECFTILYQQPGIQALQVLNSEKQWINAPPIPGTLVINLGDQFARWTNDIFKSTVHRAVNRSGIRRYSIPLFFGTDYDVQLEV
ncbi:hypothetical protein H0H92_013252 [Tricholoma furcatifolium]|nr:hypothetical protein H0H92_013252 [Tricholoma furcatifolium]